MPRSRYLPRPVPVKEILSKILKPADLRVLKRHTEIRQAWEQVIGERLRPHTRLVDYKKKVLWVEVPSSHWMQEAQFLKPQIMQALEDRLGPGVVNDLRFTIRTEKG